jgi:hypothetical protein
LCPSTAGPRSIRDEPSSARPSEADRSIEASGESAHIDGNPQLTELMNSLVNGVSLADLQVRLSLGEHPPAGLSGPR